MAFGRGGEGMGALTKGKIVLYPLTASKHLVKKTIGAIDKKEHEAVRHRIHALIA